jgi:hypothetical protein
LNTQNVANIINSPDIAAYLSNGTTQNLGNATLQSVENNYASILSGTGFLNNDQFVSNITAIQAQTTPQDQINSIQNVLGQVFYNNQKAYLLFLRGEAYKQLALQNKAVANPVSNPGTSPASGTGLPDGSACATGTTSGTGSACASGYCDTSTYPATCKENPSGSPTTGTGSGTTTSPTFSSSGVTSDVLLNAMTYAQTNSIVNSKCNCGANCKQYANSIVDAASSIGEDPVLLLSIMMQESQCDVNALNQNSVGLMQINTQQDLKTLCGAVGVNSASDITGSDVTKYVNNINCGALILKNKYDTDNQGKTYTCGTFSVPYTGWNAAIRGYIGYGCTGDPNTDVTSYVADVDNRYTALINIINQNKGPSSTNPTTGATTSTLPLTQFNTYKSLFDKYTQDNLPAVTAPNDFEALLVAIAQENNWGGSNGYLLMGYQPSNTDFQSADSQILIVSSILQSAMNGPDSTTNLGYQLGSTNAYSSCNSLASAGFVSQISCILSVYHTGQVNSAGFLTIGANTDGINYAKAVLNIWNSWDTYFNSGTGTGVSGSAH